MGVLLAPVAGMFLAGLFLVLSGLGWAEEAAHYRERLFIVSLSAWLLGLPLGLALRFVLRQTGAVGLGRGLALGLALGVAPWGWFALGFSAAAAAAGWKRPLALPAKLPWALAGLAALLLPVLWKLVPPPDAPTALRTPQPPLQAAAAEAPAGAGPDVLLVVVDTLRADAILDPAIPTPNLDALRARGAWAASAVAPSNQTLPSHLALLCALDIEKIGMRSNLSRWPTGAQLRETWGMRTLAERFRDAGYRTAGVASNPLLTEIAEPSYQDFATGFDSWNGMLRVDDWRALRDWYAEHTLIPAVLPKRVHSYVLSHLLLPTKGRQFNRHREEGRRTTDALLAWMEELQQDPRPHFLLAQYLDPHSPYIPGPEWRERLAPAEARPAGFSAHPSAELDMRMHLLDGIRAEALPPDTEAVAAYLHDLYRAEVAEFDEQFGRLMAQVEAGGRETVVLFTSDHGEAFMEHGWTEHSHTLKNEELLVPFVVAGPGVPAGVELQARPELVDAAATLISLCGLDGLGADGRDVLATDAEAPRPALAFMVLKAAVDDGAWKLEVKLEYAGEKLQPGDAGYSNDGKLAAGDYTVEPLELYDLVADPGETVNLLAERPAEVERLVAELRRRLEQDLFWDIPTRVLSASEMSRMHELGYTGED